MNAHPERAARRRDLMTVGLAGLASIAGLAAGLGSTTVALLVVALPIVGYGVGGHVAGRGAVVGCVALALATTLARPHSGAAAWVDLALLGLLAVVTGVGASAADRLASTRVAPASEGSWTRIVVECEAGEGADADPAPLTPRRQVWARRAGDGRRGRRAAPSAVR
jgi:hypothetical protein